MTKLALITDTHFGIKGDSQYMLDYQERFLSEVFFPYLKEHKINTIFHLGDLFDRRKFINFQTLDKTKKMFLDKLREYGMTMMIIPGNHDCALKSTNKINSLSILLKEYEDCIVVFEEPIVHTFKNTKFMFIPWINEENYQQVIAYVTENEHKAEYLLGHLELQGFDMYPGIRNEHGMDGNVFSQFKEVWTGHFHTKSHRNNIRYLGAPFEYNIGDCGDPKGFHIFDFETKELEFIQNPITLFEKIYWNDQVEVVGKEIKNTDFTKFKNKIIRIFVVKKTKPALFDWFIENVYKQNPTDLVINEDYSEFHADANDIDAIKDMSTSDLIKNYIDNVETDMDKDKLKNIMNNLYIEALHSEVDLING